MASSIGYVVAVAFLFVFLFTTREFVHVEGTRSLFTQQTDYDDDLYDCVDFYKQPAFDHPLLANHSFHHEMRPSSSPILTGSNMQNSQNMKSQFKRKNCPTGTVPIRRIAKEHASKYNVLGAQAPAIHNAMLGTSPGSAQKYNGAGATISIWNPDVQKSQYSAGQVIVANGNESLHIGWMVNPTLYGDNLPYIFLYTNAGATQCYNMLCPGFVHVNKNWPIGDSFIGSKPDGSTNYVRVMIQKDPKDGHWWLRLGGNLDAIGFWPKTIFTDLADHAAVASWGGVVYGPIDVPSPPMGSGNFIVGDSKKDAYCAFVRVINEENELVDAVDLVADVDTTRYETRQVGNVGGNFGNLVYYGGPGGVTGN